MRVIMVGNKKNIVLLFILFALPLSVAAQQESADMQHADSLYNNFKEEPALEQYLNILKKDPKNLSALWHTSLLYSRIGNRLPKDEDEKAYFNKGIDMAKRALAVDSTSSQANFVMSVAMGRKALISGTKQRVAASRAIKKYADLSIKYDSTNPGPWHVLGRWNLKIANLSWLERAAANTLYGGIPGDASNEQAAKDIEKAISLKDDFILYYYDLARVYRKMGKDQKAISSCRTGLTKKALAPGDDKIKDQCRELIKDLQ